MHKAQLVSPCHSAFVVSNKAVWVRWHTLEGATFLLLSMICRQLQGLAWGILKGGACVFGSQGTCQT